MAQLSDILTIVAEKTNKSTDYAGGDTALKTKFTHGINEAYRKLAKEKYPLDYSETVTLDADKCFDPSALSYSFYKIKRVVDTITDAREYSYSELQRDKFYVPDAAANSSPLVCYYYIPDALESDSDEPEIPDAIVPPEVYANYAAFYYFTSLKKYGDANYYYTLFDNFVSEAFTNRTPRKITVRRMR